MCCWTMHIFSLGGNSMQRGSALIVPQGLGPLEAGLTYHLLRHNRVIRTVQLVLFTQTKHRWLAHLYSLESATFEDALVRGLITKAPYDNGAPFLRTLDGKDPLSLDLERQTRKRVSDFDRATERLTKISPLLNQENDILCSANPEAVINAFARKHNLNEQRTRFWFFAYLCFSRDMRVLVPHYFECGKWDRLQKPNGPKFGRHSISKGALSGQRLNSETIERLVKAYYKYAKEGSTLTSIYQEAMRKDFGATLVNDDIGIPRLISTTGSILPTFDQFRYQIHKAVGQDKVQALRWGQARFRRSKQPHRGKFTTNVSNLYESVEADAYYTDERPRSNWGEGHLDPLCVTRLVDVASGMRLGIGFAIGSESSESYNAAMFCAAIPKTVFCKLFGIDINEAEWPSQGLPTTLITDRGPGIKRARIDPSGLLHGPAIHEFTPSGQGQSKALVESSQRRRTKLEGPNQHSESNLTFHQMMVREIRRVLLENKTADTTSRLTPEMLQQHTAATPLGVWRFLDARARNDGTTPTFDQAVRSFLMSTEVSLSRAGVMLKSQAYSSAALRNTKLIQQLGGTTIRIKAYVLAACVRHIWVEIDGKLLQLDAQLSLRDDTQMLYRTFNELNDENRELSKQKSKLRQDKQSLAVAQQNLLLSEHGGDWNAAKRLRGKRKRTPEAKAEQAVVLETYDRKMERVDG